MPPLGTSSELATIHGMRGQIPPGVSPTYTTALSPLLTSIHIQNNDKATSLRCLLPPKSPMYGPAAVSELHENRLPMLVRETTKEVRAEGAA
jgi:hypothetical protein